MIAYSTVQHLKSSFRGELIVPGDQRYDAARMVFNVTIDRRPALIARCADSDDVIQAVNLARQENLLVSVRGSGHNVAGFAVCDNGLVIDLSGMGTTIPSCNSRRHFTNLCNFNGPQRPTSPKCPTGGICLIAAAKI